MATEFVWRIMTEYPGVHTACGLSNISYGLPQRKFVNRVFLSLLMASGLDGAIIDPLDDKMIAILKTTQMLLGQDQYCMNYIRAARAGQIVAWRGRCDEFQEPIFVYPGVLYVSSIREIPFQSVREYIIHVN